MFDQLVSDSDRSFKPGWAREIFSGAGGLTRALRKAGLQCRAPMEAYPGPGRRRYVPCYDLDRVDVFVALVRECLAGCYAYLHFGLACRVANGPR